ncbi:FKBP-type peptidyl-prolyl cis-trans isomerase [Dysgonomonas sp. ZJ279]|uniref:FKBP-type peptidyl-prolyl cis-trans isomerase n=1 Tax=Dysgonomonas sp. ZJ279 TaxID=2709796 RepID=UPI0013ECCA46|nr:FKBP-type peptidyl-prolyl cis-trans isomerase [Dysgonomonas sp. ZJ279]
MKKIQVVALCAFTAFGAFLTSCSSGVSTNVSLKNETDSVSYAYGASLYDQGLSAHLQQLGLVSDTAGMRAYYQSQIAAAADDAKKASLEKEFKTKLDSIVSLNNKNSAEFIKGIQEGLNSTGSKEAYLAGLNIGGQISKQMFPYFVEQLYGADAEVKQKISTDMFLSGIATAMQKSKFAIDNPSELIEGKMKAAQERASAGQREEGDKFLAENKTKEGVVTLPDGLQYKVIKEGNGPKPAATDVVKVHYHGTLIDGTVFDSSVQRNEPATFGVNQVIPGWTEALQLMPVGSKWMVYVPADLAYGAADRGPIKPYSALIFEVELLGIESAK